MKKDIPLTKHPLVQSFGLALKALRKKEPKKAAQAAQDLGVGESLYRLLESGSAILQPSKAVDLIKAFPNSEIDFARLSTLLVIFQIIASDRPTNARSTIQQAAELGKVSNEAEELFTILRPIWEELHRVSDSRAVASKIEKYDIPRSLLTFLAQKAISTEGASNTQWIYKRIAKTPPLFLDLAAKVIGGLNQYAPFMNVDSVKHWEADHRSRLRSEYAFVSSLDGVIDTCDEFDWSFLEDASFSTLKFVCWGKADEEKKHQRKLRELKDKILKNVTSDGRNQSLAMRIDESLSLAFVQEDDLISEIEKNLNVGSQRSWEHAWIYKLSPEEKNLSEYYFVAIMDNRKSGRDSYECVHGSPGQTQGWVNVIATLTEREAL